MHLHRLIIAAGFAIVMASPTIVSAQTPPTAKRVPKVDTLHGDVLRDDYFWLREKSNPEVIRYLEAENAYTEAGLSHTKALQDTLYRELLGRVKETDLSVPYFDSGYWYYTRTEQGKSYPIFCRRKGTIDAPEEIYLDQNALAHGHKFHSLGGVDVSPDGNLLIYLEDTTAFREYTLFVKDLRTGALLPDAITNVWNGTAWADDNRTFFYMRADSAKRGNAVFRHTIGALVAGDTKVFQEDNVLYNVSVSRSKSGKYVFIPADGFTSSEWRVIPTAQPTSAPRIIAARRPAVEYSVDHIDGAFLIQTNDNATNFRIVRAPENDPSPRNWRDWQAANDSVFIEYFDVFRKHTVVAERFNGLRRLRVVELANDTTHFITFPEVAYGVFPSNNPDYSSTKLRFSYSSLAAPGSVFDYDMVNRTRELRKRQEIPSGFDPSKYEVRRVMAPARDGNQVPVSILLPKSFPMDGSRPLLLYAYGSYGATTEPTFNANVISLVDRGFGYAIAHVRGGQEMGRRWYDEGKMMKKKNTFNDFIDVADYLVREKYTSPQGLVANGGSAGGLLMGVVVNMRPDLFRAVAADVPFVDVINTMLDASVPLTAQEWEQWGNPRNPEHYAYMKSYSPYDNVEAKAYPAILVTTSLNDSQVMYWEPAKWVAKLRATKTDRNALYFKTNLAGGHGGSSGRYDALKEVAFRYAFMIDAVGGTRPPIVP